MTSQDEREEARDELLAVRLNERVAGINNDLQDIRRSNQDLDRRIEKSQSDILAKLDSALTTISVRFESAISTLNSKVDERSRVPWQGWTVAISVIIAIGALAYLPISQKQADLAELIKDDRGMMTKMSERNAALFDRLEERVVPRGEHEEKWRSFESQHADLKASIQVDVTNLQAAIIAGNTNLQRQIDEVERRSADVYTQRDAMKDEKERVDILNRQVSELISRMPQNH